MSDTNNEVILVGLCGRAGVGKTTIADALVEITRRFVDQAWSSKWSLSQPIKEFLSDLGYEKGKSSLFRDQAQALSVLRERDPDVYVRALVDRIRRWKDLRKIAIEIIDDIRFPNEIGVLRREFPKSVFVKLDRRYDSPLDDRQAKHASEAQIDELGVDYTLDNNRTPAEAAENLWVVINARLHAFKHKFYVAGPLTNGDREQNLLRAVETGRALTILGHQVFIPHAQDWVIHGNDGCKLGDEKYNGGFAAGVEFLKNWANAVFRVDGPSWGTDQEVAWARDHGRPVMTNFWQVPNGRPKNHPWPITMGLSDVLFPGNVKLPSI